MRQSLTAFALAMALSASSASALACDAAGPNKHVGQVVAIDMEAGTFTIMDAQTRKPISFQAQADVLNALTADSEVMVSYKGDDGQLKAVSLHEL